MKCVVKLLFFFNMTVVFTKQVSCAYDNITAMR